MPSLLLEATTITIQVSTFRISDATVAEADDVVIVIVIASELVGDQSFANVAYYEAYAIAT